MIHIILDSGYLADAVHFAKEKLMLIAIKAGMQGLTKFIPLHGFQLVSHILNPTFCWAKKLHARALDPNGKFNRVHLNVVFSTCDPKFEINAIKGWEGHFRQLASGITVVFRRAIARQHQTYAVP
jgi:hypothetical protein